MYQLPIETIIYDIACKFLSLHDISQIALLNKTLYTYISARKEYILLNFYHTVLDIPGSHALGFSFFNSILNYFDYEYESSSLHMLILREPFIFAPLIPRGINKKYFVFIDGGTPSWKTAYFDIGYWLDVEGISKGNLDYVKWYFTVFCKHRPEGLHNCAMNVAADHGQLEVLKWLHDQGYNSISEYAMDSAANNGHLNVVQFLHENRTEGCTTAAIDTAAMNGHFDVIQFLTENRNEGCTTDAIDYAVEIGRIDIVKYLLEHRHGGITQASIYSATMNNRLDILQLLHDYFVFDYKDVQIIQFAILNNNLNMVLWLLEIGFSLTEESLYYAASEGHLEIFRFIYTTYPELGNIFIALDKARKNGCRQIIAYISLVCLNKKLRHFFR